MPRARYQRGTLRTSVPGKGPKPERTLPLGTIWERWYKYVTTPDGTEKRQEREKIINRELVEKLGIAEGLLRTSEQNGRPEGP